MFKNLKRVSYYVQDIRGAMDWYSKLFNTQPVYNSPLIVIFKINDTDVVLLPFSDRQHDQQAAAYWEVNDTDEVFQQLINLGAFIVKEPRTIVNTRIAEVSDPFGNVIGLTSNIPEKEKPFSEQPSESAYTVTFCRAISAAEPRKEIKGPDNLAYIFLHEEAQQPLKDPLAREWVMNNILTGGAYEFFVARTAFVDELFRISLLDAIPQIVFLGAGYDTRAYRFCKYLGNTKIFEMDSFPTLRRKVRLLAENKIDWPDNVKHIPIDFTKDNIKELLVNNGYETDKRTLFIWEGVTYYLSAENFYNSLSFIKNNSSPGSLLFFDYMLYSEERHSRPNIKEALERMKKTYKSEPVNFMINEGNVNKILSGCGFKILEQMNTKEMENKYLRLRDGSLAGHVIDLFSCVIAESI